MRDGPPHFIIIEQLFKSSRSFLGIMLFFFGFALWLAFELRNTSFFMVNKIFFGLFNKSEARTSFGSL